MPGPVLLVSAVLMLAQAVSPSAVSPDDAQQALRLVEGLLAKQDYPAARSRLEQAAAAHPEDCGVRAWLVWSDIESGRDAAAQALLGADGCPADTEDRGRWTLLRALAADRRQDAEGVRGALRELDERQPLWPEDCALARTLSGRHRDDFSMPLEVRAEVALGATSNAFAASPVDTARLDAQGSGVARPDLFVRLRAPERALTPLLDLAARGYGIAATEARELSHAQVSAAVALRLSRAPLRPTFRYQHEELFLDMATPRYAAADGAEVEVMPSPGLALLGGIGRRSFFSDDWRTRTEIQLVALQATSLFRRPLVLGAAVRYYDARRSVHDQLGGTLTAASNLPLRASLRARLAVSGSLDDFPRSGGPDGMLAFGTTERRRDLTLRLSAGVWRALSSHAALGLSYEFARRWSSADNPEVRYYPYVDHRVLLSLRLGASGNPWRASSPPTPGRVRLPYRDLEEWSLLWDEQLRSLLHQQDDLAADCGECTVP